MMWWKCKRTWSRIFWLALVLLGLLALVVVAFVGPWPAISVEQGNKRASAAAARLLDRAGTSLDLEPGPLQAGQATRRITLDSDLPLAGYPGRRNAGFVGAANALHIRALALGNGRNRVLMFGADLLLVSEALVDQVRRELKRRARLAAHEIVFTVTHTHSAPSSSSCRFLGRCLGGKGDSRFIEQLAEGFVQAGLEAVETMRPALFGSFQVEAGDLAAGDGSVDTRLRGMVVRFLDGGRAVVLNFGARPTVLGPENLRVSGDYPGYAQAALARRLGTMPLFQAGAIHGVLPLPPAVSEDDRAALGPVPGAERASHARARALGEELARRAEAALASVQFREDAVVAALGAHCPLPPLQARIDQDWRLSPAVPWLAGMRGKAYLQGVRIGDLVLVALPVEFSGALLHELVRDEPADGPHLWISSLSGGCQGVAGWEAAGGLIPWLDPRDPVFFHTVATTLRDLLVGP
jgi:hypothetical protein